MRVVVWCRFGVGAKLDITPLPPVVERQTAAGKLSSWRAGVAAAMNYR